MSRSLAALLCLLTPAAACAQTKEEQAAICKTVDAYLDAITQRDLKGVMATVARKAPDRATIEKGTERFFENFFDIRISDRRLSAWKVEGDKVRVRLRYLRTLRVDGKDREESFRIDVLLVKEEGRWVIWKFAHPILNFADDMLAAKTKEERTRLLQEEKDLVGDDLLDVLFQRTCEQMDQRRDAEVDRLVDIYTEVANRLGTGLAKAKTDLLRAEVCKSRSQPYARIKHLKAAREQLRGVKEWYWATLTDQDLASAYLMLGDCDEAEKYVEESLRFIVEEADRPGANEQRLTLARAGAYTVLGLIKIARSDNSAARTAGSRALKYALATKNPYHEGGARRVLGLVLVNDGRLAEGLKQLQTAVQLLPVEKNPEEYAAAAIDLAYAYFLLDRLEEAQQILEKLRDVCARLRFPGIEARVRANLALIYMLRGNYKPAVAEFQASLDRLSKTEDRPALLLVLTNIGVAVSSVEKFEVAEKVLSAAALVARTGKMPDAEALALTNLGCVALKRGKHADALRHHERALAMGREAGNLRVLSSCWSNLGDVHRSTGDWEKAAGAYEQAIAAIEQMRSGAVEPSLQRSYFERQTDPYHRLVQCRIKLGQNEKAFAAMEQAKARTLIELLENGRADISGSLTTLEQRDERQKRDRLERAELRMHQSLGGEERANALKELNDARTDLDTFERDLFLRHTDLRDRRARFAPASLKELSETFFGIEPNLAVLSFSVAGDETLLLVLTREPGEMQPRLFACTLPISRQELAKRVHKLLFLCTVEESNDFEKEAAALFEVLIKPAEEQLKGKQHVVVLPEGPLQTLPFQVLLDGDRKYLIQRCSLSYAPSATALLKMLRLAEERNREPAPKLPAVVMGRPVMPTEDLSDLKDMEEEAKTVAGKLGVVPRLGRDASETFALREFPEASYIHVATHGVISPAAPLYSFIALAKDGENDGLLQARKLLAMKLKARLVVLSACETGTGQEQYGEGLLGLGWSLFVAGSPSNMLTLWSVSDKSTEILMGEFYKFLKPEGPARRGTLTKAEALRQAQLAVLNVEKTKHPRHWAAFILVGDWGR